MTVGQGPIRGTLRLPDNRLAGVRSAGTSVRLFLSNDPTHQGASWQNVRSVVSGGGSGVTYHDPFLARAADGTLFCAYRIQNASGQFKVGLSRSANNGVTWTADTDVTGWNTRFVGAPFLHQRTNGNLQVYYDSEVDAAANGDAGDQWIAMKERNGIAGLWDENGTVIAARSSNISQLSRDGMPTIVRLEPFNGNERLMCVVEGVATGAGHNWNVVRAYQSFDGGRTWNYADRQTVYQSSRTSGNDRYNAYNPYAIRVGNGPVRVAFCTDEAKPGAPDATNAPVNQRFAHVRYVQTTNDFESWGTPQDIWTADALNYNPGLFEVAPNHVLCTIDNLDGSVLTLRDPPADLTAPAPVSSTLSFARYPEVSFTFDEPVSPAGLSASALQASVIGSGLTTTATSFRQSADGKTLIFTLPTSAPAGAYRFRLPANTLRDTWGNTLTTATDLQGTDVYLLPGDLDRDRVVGFSDLLTMAQAYGSTGATYLQGNLDADESGRVEFSDLLILAQNYGQSQPATTVPGPYRQARPNVGRSAALTADPQTKLPDSLHTSDALEG